MGGVLDPVAFDIETTGFDVSDEVTAAGFAFPMGTQVFVQANGNAAGDVAAAVQDRIDAHVNVSVHESEAGLLDALAGFVADRVRGDDVLLVAAYDALCGGTVSTTDPFADSAEAVDAFEDGRVVDVAVHNAVDVLRTQALARLAQRYCSKADFDVKSLTPVIQE